jgi:hypothetical protein
VPKYYVRNTGKEWTDADVRQLKKLAKEDTPTGLIGSALGRTKAAVYTKASEEGISLMPPNPSHRRK